MSAAGVLSLVLVATVFAQAAFSRLRVSILIAGAGLSTLLAPLLGVAPAARVIAGVPWDVLIILVALGVLSEMFAESSAFDRMAVAVTRFCGGAPGRLTLVFALAMYFASGLVNNLTALLLVLPVMLVLVRLIGSDRRYVSWTLGTLLVACNLGGAATPIGDFPAILLLARGGMAFSEYLMLAFPATLVALALVLLVVATLVRPARDLPDDPLTRKLTVAVVTRIHRRIRLRKGIFVPALLALCGMLVAWLLVPTSSGVGPDTIAWIGTGAAVLAFRGRGERLVRQSLQAQAVLPLLALFVMVSAVRETGAFDDVARGLMNLPLSSEAKLVVFLVMTSLLTALFSAGPSMAALLEVAETLTKTLPYQAVYVGLALAVCAGSSLLLTAATSGPLAQALAESADLRDQEGNRVRFGFREHIKPGLLGYLATLAVAIGFALYAIRS